MIWIRCYYLVSCFYQNTLMGVLAIFSTGTFAIIGTMCVESETCYEKYQEKKNRKSLSALSLMPWPDTKLKHLLLAVSLNLGTHPIFLPVEHRS